MATGTESEPERRRRHRLRRTFDRVALLYQASRPGYPDDIVEFLVSTAGLQPGSAVLEVGCGTGQLTASLAGHGFRLTAIDLGPAMIETARQRLGSAGVSFQATAFEDYQAPEGSLDLIVSGSAYHWIDPEVKFARPARLLRPGGWLALLATGEHYDEPPGPALMEMWIARSDDDDAWLQRPEPSDSLIPASTAWFGDPVTRFSQRRLVLPAETVVSVENTRATALSWPDEKRLAFTAELRQHLRGLPPVVLTQQTTLTLAPLLRD